MRQNGRKTSRAAEFGDFQTPPTLAHKVCSTICAPGLSPRSIIEPTCGTGNLLLAAWDAFPAARNAVALDINPEYVKSTAVRLHKAGFASRTKLICDSFFTMDWDACLHAVPEPILIVGNPPWVTNAELSALHSSNHPTKSNFQGHAGFDAVTGKSNFDISEWMLIHLLERLKSKRATLAMLCKTTVARKVLAHAWKTGLHIAGADIFLIDAAKYFEAAVDACLLVCRTEGRQETFDCFVHPNLETRLSSHHFGFRDAQLVADTALYDRWKHLRGPERYKWRSGVKHDCSSIMELRRLGRGYVNGLGESIDLENTFLYPLLKSSDVANGMVKKPSRFLLVTQSTVGEDTTIISERAPKTSAYLHRHARLLDGRASSIYKKRPRFSIFGIGPYTFAPWKVAISGFYKSLKFKVVGNVSGKSIVLDDTVYFIPCRTRAEAEYLASLLNSTEAGNFFRSLVFWDNKRPVTVELLRRLDILALAREHGTEKTASRYLRGQPVPRMAGLKPLRQLGLFALS